jgi:hypothetical protein
MSKLRSAEARPLLRKSTTDTKAKLFARQTSSSQIQPKLASSKNKKDLAKSEIVHLHHNEADTSDITRPIPWWVFPQERGLFGGLPGMPGGMMPGMPGGMMPGGPGGMMPGGPGGMMPGGLGGGMFPGPSLPVTGLFPPGPELFPPVPEPFLPRTQTVPYSLYYG